MRINRIGWTALGGSLALCLTAGFDLANGGRWSLPLVLVGVAVALLLWVVGPDLDPTDGVDALDERAATDGGEDR